MSPRALTTELPTPGVSAGPCLITASSVRWAGVVGLSLMVLPTRI
jgi:hypothetical protein